MPEFSSSRWSRPIAFVLALALIAISATAATNYDESKVGTYTLPDPLVMQDGTPVRDAATWMQKRRPELLEIYRREMYGRSPGRPETMTFDVWDTDAHALGGKAIRKQIRIGFGKPSPVIDVLLYIPVGLKSPPPVFVGEGFAPNYRATTEPAVPLKPTWNNRQGKWLPADAAGRGTSKMWQFDQILSRGYAIAIMYYCDIEPDYAGQATAGVRGLYLTGAQTQPASDDEWGAIGAWAWGYSRALDYIETDKDVDAKRAIIIGQSRLGKTTMWAGASDERWAMVVASCSGEGGAALARRDYGETIHDMATHFGYQFCRNYQKYKDDAGKLPVDTHELVALIAPRPLFLNTGSEDQWGDPRGEFLAAVASEPVWKLLGKQALGLSADQMPPNDNPVLHDLGFWCHTGKHDILPTDWPVILEFADMHLKK